MAKIYTLVNQKGGVGKTTSAINLGAYLGYFCTKVLIVDLDPQANATSSLGIDKLTVKNGTYEVVIGSAPIAPSILHNPRLNYPSCLHRPPWPAPRLNCWICRAANSACAKRWSRC